MGRARRQLALGDDMALVDAHEEAGLGLRRRHEDQPFPAHAQTKGEISLSGSGRRGFQIGGGGGGGGGARRGLTLPGEVNRLLPRRNPSGGEGLYRRRRGGGLATGEKWAVPG